MADRYYSFDVTVPAGTQKTAPTTTALPWNDGIVRHIKVVIPSGHVGLTGYQIAYGGQQVVPDNTGGFYTGNSQEHSYFSDKWPTGPQWQFVAYNTDTFDHTFHVHVEVDDLPVPERAPRQLRNIA